MDWILSWAFNAWNDENTWKHWKKKNKDKNCENFSDLEITDVVLVHCNIINNNLQINSGFEYTCFL